MPSENTPGYGVENPRLVGNPKDWGEGWAIYKVLLLPTEDVCMSACLKE